LWFSGQKIQSRYRRSYRTQTVSNIDGLVVTFCKRPLDGLWLRRAGISSLTHWLACVPWYGLTCVPWYGLTCAL
jgi:hypothetical protein